MIFNLFKKKLPKKILLLSALPFDNVSFYKAYSSHCSDFIDSLKKTYGVVDGDALWSQYQPYAEQMRKTFNIVQKYGGVVVKDFSLADLERTAEYDIVIVLAHHSDISDEIEIGNQMIRARQFVDKIPPSCQIILDITSCYSAHLIPWIKARIPSSKIIGINSPTSLKTRLDVIAYTVIMMAENSIDDYIETFQSAWNNIGVTKNNVINDDVKLGSKFQSSIYAPSEVRRGEEFVLSVFLHKTEDCDEIEIMARNIDPTTAKRNQLFLKTRLKRGDLIEFQIYYNETLYSGLDVDEYKKEIYWDNTIESVDFLFTINQEFNKTAFVGKIKLFVNKEPVGDMVYKVSVVDNYTSNRTNSCPISFESYEKHKDMDEHRSQIIDILRNKINDPAATSADIEMCQKCINLIQNKPSEKRNSPLRVFIS